MEEFSFKAIGTKWSILVDGDPLTEVEKSELLALIAQFEKNFSRFLPGSLANQYREASPREYKISEEFADILQTADILRDLTDGAYDPAVGTLLEHAGYDKEYSFVPNEKIEDYVVPRWSLSGTTLTLKDPLVFDIGGIGKGYCIDKVADFLKSCNHAYFLVEAGGDMYATEKVDGSGFQIALEWPGKTGVAFGTLVLKQQGLAVSDSFRRRWKDWHHIIDPITKKSVEKIIGCAAVTKSAFYADCMTSGIFLSPKEKYNDLAETFGAEFVVFTKEGNVVVSENWPGEFLS